MNQLAMSTKRPILALTMGDGAGIGPELIAKVWADPTLFTLSRPIVVGDRSALERAVRLIGGRASLVEIDDPLAAESTPNSIPYLDPSRLDLGAIPYGQIDVRAGRGAFDYLVAAIDLALEGRIDGIVTLPLQKESLRAAGVAHPGHTEILAERTGSSPHAMMLYVGPAASNPEGAGLGVLHATLHVPLREVFDLLTEARVLETIELADEGLQPLTVGRRPRIGVAGLNPHAGENGLFGDEEARIIAPAIAEARRAGRVVAGPIPADTLFRRGLDGEFDAVIAMYHDQGHAAIKTAAFDRAVNVTLGLPIVRTSVAHGTAFDIAGQGIADTSSLLEAVRVAARLVAARHA